jgi:hypothetical protein
MKRVLVVAPLREDAQTTVRLLIQDGPPFDLTGTGLERHEVFLTDREAVFVFEGDDPRVAVERLLGEATVWRAAVAWRECLAGRPRIAEQAFAWDRPVRPLHVPGL